MYYSEDEYTAPDLVEEGELIQRLDKGGWISIISGGVMALIVYYIPFFRSFLQPVITLVHEIGHSFFGWLFGYPSIPTFDFHYGGGFAAIFSRKMFIVVIVYIALASLFWFFRRNKLLLGGLVVLIAGYSVLAFTDAQHVIIGFMGHGTELVFAGIFLYRALGGTSIKTAVERPLYAFIGFFILIADISFSSSLLNDQVSKIMYMLGKGGMGGHENDFKILALDYFKCNVDSVILFFFICCFIPPVISFLLFRYKYCIIYFINKFSSASATE